MYLDVFAWQVSAPATAFCSPVIMQDHNNNSNQRHLQWGQAIWPLFVIPELLRSRSTQARWNLHPFLIFTYELNIPLWADCGLPNTLHGAKRRWCIVLVGYWSWWLTQYDTSFHRLIAAPSWIGHKPTETYWPWWKAKKKKKKGALCLYMTHFVAEKSLLDIKQPWKAPVNGRICQHLLQGCQEGFLCSTLRKELTSVTYPGERTAKSYRK